MINQNLLLTDDFQKFLRESLQNPEVMQKFRAFITAREALIKIILDTPEAKKFNIAALPSESSEFVSQSVAMCKTFGQITEKEVSDFLTSEYGISSHEIGFGNLQR
ncbi:MAG: hypothetical protein F6K26_03260 [Moorea sp. SIO2I5]|nr:hypothetical protein [Moorena sp. SIO2I5]